MALKTSKILTQEACTGVNNKIAEMKRKNKKKEVISTIAMMKNKSH